MNRSKDGTQVTRDATYEGQVDRTSDWKEIFGRQKKYTTFPSLKEVLEESLYKALAKARKIEVCAAYVLDWVFCIKTRQLEVTIKVLAMFSLSDYQ